MSGRNLAVSAHFPPKIGLAIDMHATPCDASIEGLLRQRSKRFDSVL